jgi:glycosyltransferase involved in cell wall biosynthesis
VLDGLRIVVVMPAYNAAQTLRRTWEELPHQLVDQVIVTDDASTDATAAVAASLGLTLLRHPSNRGYGANQKTCYRAALDAGADIVVMVHPDYQYSPRLVTAMAAMVVSGHYDLVLGSRILGGTARSGGMPRYKYLSNRALTAVENLLCGSKLSEFHTGFRAYSRRLLEAIPFEKNADAFVFDNEVIVQALYFGFAIGELSCPTRYFPEASSISFWPSVGYGLGVLATATKLALARRGIGRYAIFTE